MRPHIVDAKQRGATVERRDGGADRGSVAPDRPRLAEDARQRRLARHADQHGAPQRDDPIEPPEELEVVLGRLPEADPRVDADPVLGDPGVDRERDRSSRNETTSETTSS